MVVIDGAVPPDTRDALLDATGRAMARMPAAGIVRPPLTAGTRGRAARIPGAGALPLTHFFQPDGALDNTG